MAKRKATAPRTHRKVSLKLSAETDEKLTIQARRERITRSMLANDVLAGYLATIVVSIRGAKAGEAEAAGMNSPGSISRAARVIPAALAVVAAGAGGLAMRWEYLRVRYLIAALPSDIDAQLAALGREGWELAAIDRGAGFMFFKRPVQVEPDTPAAAAGQGG